MKLRRQGKKAKAAFLKAVLAVFEELGVQPLDDEHRWAFMYTHSVETKHGELVLDVRPSEYRGISVFGRFTDIDRANAGRPSTGMYGDHNPHTGKWNLHCLCDDEEPDNAAEALRLRLGSVAACPCGEEP